MTLQAVVHPPAAIAGYGARKPFNKVALLSVSPAVLLIAYFAIPHVALSSVITMVLFLVIAPLFSFITSLIAIHQIKTGELHQAGLTLSYIAFVTCGLYLITVFALAVVMFFFYFIYTFILS